MHANVVLAFASALAVANAANAVNQANGYTNIGCFNETLQVTGRRALSGNSLQEVKNDMTVESCTKFCAGKKYAGLEYQTECYCGDDLAPQAIAISSSRCSSTCSGNQQEICGGRWALSLYQTTSSLGNGGGAQAQTSSAWNLLPSQPLVFGSLAAVSLAIAAIL